MKPFYPIGLLILSLSFGACKKGGGSTSNGASIYIAGFDNGDIDFWKDGKKTFLSTAAPGYNGGVTGIAVVNEDVYVTGFIGDTAVYWKNGTETYLSNPDSAGAAATGIASYGNDVYIAGFEQTGNANNVLYWKNGVKTIVGSTNNTINAVSLALASSRVYIAATIGNDTAAGWLDGEHTTFGVHNSYAYGIAIIGGAEAYVVGVDNGKPVYWANGTETTLPYTASAACYAITIVAGTVYIAGVDNGNAVYWKDGKEKVLDAGAAFAIAVSGTDVYVTGYKFDASTQTSYAVYWKNGATTILATSPPGTIATETGNAITVTTP